ncbi:MAG TPA: cytochrome c3 family protein [Anaeromyxobacteraceae bacterium]|nr:cytochrome c3 family protein [Anaeromyxobacteraceae bacterium]
MSLRRLGIVLAVSAPVAALGVGGHDKIGCTGCHSMHDAKGDDLYAVAPNRKMLNPKTNQPHSPVTQFCLACHADPADGGKGLGSVANHLGHPFSAASPNPRLAKVPPALLRDGQFECVACHDPHPSNPNYRYLRVASGKQAPSMTVFCVVCHPGKADPNKAPPPLFDSMDETRAQAGAKPAGSR